jgi:hypothetical protein
MASYKVIQNWIRNEYGFVVKTCWIADIKEQCGLPMRKAPNRYDEDIRTNPCPTDKIESIKRAFKHFHMID